MWWPNSTAQEEESRFAPGATPGALTDEELPHCGLQIAYSLRQTESGRAVADISRQLGMTEATFYEYLEAEALRRSA
jgi:hypothetical protein